MSKNNNYPTISVGDILRPTIVEVNISRLRENFEAIKAKVGASKIMPILKANAYGHGLVQTARLMEEFGADYLGVAVLEEGVLLRELGIRLPILVLGGIIGNQIPLFIENDLTITASSPDKIKQINETAEQLNKKAKVHLKIDTGLERIGVHYYSSEKFIEEALKCKWLEVEGIYSHFASSYSSDKSYTNLQLERFNDVLEYFEKNSLKPPIRHIANSGAILQHKDSYFDLVRPGIMCYGVYPSEDVERSVRVLPTLSWKSRVVYFKVIKPNHPVGYDSTWQSDHNVRAVTVPVGYGDGYFRSMHKSAQVIIRGKRYPIIGGIAMDQIIVNIENDSAFNNDEVCLIGNDGNERISVEELANWAGTIPYEILTNINTRVPRVYY
ncbi:MAG: alanine racemase [Bacteroidetes bacterium]|nr:alanine racemase [Bacteroidota bacterium]